MPKKSAYNQAVDYLMQSFYDLWQEGYNTELEYMEACEGLKELSASEVMEMYKAWKDSE